ncbi:hypothetical protein L9F63_000625 [Diploptera punctata]|uniref:AN1-type zinc finger and ubiquitin domain-containing protein 1 n=1 Tax=Diploptera punctata TaxID=6984 RepID=A0AAD8AL77_DIPPU|nr:hypothetical protein L9F63_000625 [Diploptera punctata]
MSEHGYQGTFRSSLPQEGTMDLYIETLTGTAFEMTVSPFDTVMSIKSKIQRVEGIPVSHQHLLYNLQELDDSACLIDYEIEDGATLKLVLSMRGGPISTRRLPPGEELAWKELRDFVESNREDMFERLPPGCRVTVLVFREGDQVNLFRVIENDDGTYSPLSESWTTAVTRNLFAEEEPEESAKRLQENSITMEKMQELRTKMEKISLQKKPKKSIPRVVSAKRALLQNRRGTPRPQHNRKPRTPEYNEVPQTKSQTNILQLPPINKHDRSFNSTTSLQQNSGGYLATSSLLQAQNPVHSRRNRDVDTKLSSDDNNLQLPAIGRRRSQHQIFPDILSSPLPVSASRKILHPIGTTGPILDAKPQRNPEYGQGRRGLNASLAGKMEKSIEDLSLSGNKNISVISTPNIAILQLFTISQPPRERVTTAISNNQNRFRVSRLILDDNDRPKTSPEELTEHQKSTQGTCDILSDTKLHRQRRKVHGSISQLETSDISKKDSENEIRTKDLTNHERKSTIDLSLPVQSSLIDVTVRSPRYGRRGMLPSSKSRDITSDVDGKARNVRRRTIVHQAHQLVGEMGKTIPSIAHDINPQSHAPNKKGSMRTRCAQCRKRLNITNVYTCRCDKLFCAAHRYSELHNCTFDYKTEGRKILEQTNPLVTAPKLPKI